MTIDEFTCNNFRIEEYDTINKDPIHGIWKNFTHPCYHLRPELLSIIENSHPEDLNCRYLVIRNLHSTDSIAAIIYFQHLEFKSRNFNFGKRSLLNFLVSVFLKIRSFRIILAGNLFSVDFSPVCYDPSIITPDQLSEIIISYGKRNRSDITVLKDFPPEFSKSAMQSLGYSPFETDLTMQMQIDPAWKNLTDYSNALTHKYAQRFRKVRKQGSVLVRTQISRSKFGVYKADIERLFKNVSDKQTVRMGIVDGDYFENMLKLPDEKFWIIAYELENKMVGFSSYFSHDGTLEVHYIGIDYHFNRDYAIYFNILFDGIEQAIKMGKKELELGRTAREAKAVVGCSPVYFNDFVYVRSKTIQWLMDFLRDHFQNQAGETWKNRHPFKTSNSFAGEE